MTVQSGQSITVIFTTRTFSSGAATNATGTPAGTLYLNGTVNGATVTVTNVTTGIYTASVTLPTLAVKDEVELVIAATVAGVSDNAVIWGDSKDVLVDSSGDVTFNNTSIATVTSVTNAVTANTTQLAGQTVTAAAGVTFPTSVASPTNITAGTITTTTNLTNAPTAGDFTTAMKTSLNASTPASVTTVTGNVNGSVGSVFGAVGSVTGNIGGSMAGSVVGSVGSVLAGGLIDLTVTTFAEPTSVVGATATLKDMINWLKLLSRNLITQTSTTETVFKDDGTTVVSTSTDSDNGTIFSRGRWS